MFGDTEVRVLPPHPASEMLPLVKRDAIGLPLVSSTHDRCEIAHGHSPRGNSARQMMAKILMITQTIAA